MKNINQYSILLSALMIVGFLSFISCNNNFNVPKPSSQTNRCGTMEGYQQLLKENPQFAKAESDLERQINQYLENRINDRGQVDYRSGIVTIPVVVHVVYNNSTENISDAQIQSQIDVLNEDFRRLNSDVSGVPSTFTSVVADSRIEFVLAKRDPNCNPTTGITRTSTSVSAFNYNSNGSTPTARNPVKFNASNGKDGWPPTEYLNIWVCDLSGGLLGYAAFPSFLSSRPNEDGVVCDYQYFGDIGTATSPYDLGRSATHEIGHWLNLRHIWGDDGSACTGSDLVSDTPNQGGSNGGCPTHPNNSCSSADMFMNYMDYVDDDCMIMFSNGQSDRMDAVLYTTRSSIVSSQGDVPPIGPSQDLWSQDMADDIGDEPNNISNYMYRSDDIWIRNSNDGIANQEHQNPTGGALNYVYVRVRNRGCGSAASGNVKLYWAKASPSLSWPSPWDGSGGLPTMGSPIGTQSTGSVSASGYTILEFPWTAPNPADYSSFGADKTHFCLLSRIETSSTTPFGMTFPETSNLGANVQNNNNIVWKNISVTEPSGGGRYTASVVINNFTRDVVKHKLTFTIPKGETNLFEHGTLKVKLNEKLYSIWKEGGAQANGVELLGENTMQVFENKAFLDGLKLKPQNPTTLELFFEPFDKKTAYKRNVYTIELQQLESQTNRFIGAQLFTVKT